MTDPRELDELLPGEAKRQRAAMNRRIEKGGGALMASKQYATLILQFPNRQV